MGTDPHRRRGVLLAASAMFLVVVRLVVDDASAALTPLFVIPVALLAVKFGLWAGLGAAADRPRAGLGA